MTLTIVGRVCDNHGHALTHRGPGGYGADLYLGEHPFRIVLDVDHDIPVGEVRHLERDDSGIWAVAESDVDELADAGPLYFSPDLGIARDDDDDTITGFAVLGLALTDHPAYIVQRPVDMIAGSLFSRHRDDLNRHRRARLERAFTTHRARNPDDPIRLVDLRRDPDHPTYRYRQTIVGREEYAPALGTVLRVY